MDKTESVTQTETAKHTPGPWFMLCQIDNMADHSRQWTIASPSRPKAYGGQVAVVGWPDLTPETVDANARLIAAAPALAAACMEAEDMITQDMEAVKPNIVMQAFTALDSLRAALASAGIQR